MKRKNSSNPLGSLVRKLSQTDGDLNDYAAKKAAFEGTTAALMMVDRDFIVTAVNSATKKLLND